MDLTATPLADGLRFGECPRWHEGRLWLSDFYDHQVKTVDLAGRVQGVLEVPGQPGGLGWLPDGRLLVVSMRDRRVLRLDGAGLVEHADLSRVAPFHCNDLVVDRAGRAYIGNFGFDLTAELARRGAASVIADHPQTVLVRVGLDGRVAVVADGLSFPNGVVLVDDERRLLVAETIAFRITSFAIGADGLADRRVFSAPPPGPHGPRAPDGLCVDAAGGVWFANALAPECVRVDANGAVTDAVQVGTRCFGCALGGDDGHTLFVVGAESDDPQVAAATRGSVVWSARVGIPAAR
jgi:sugar lactone lactonase YvrE